MRFCGSIQFHGVSLQESGITMKSGRSAEPCHAEAATGNCACGVGLIHSESYRARRIQAGNRAEKFTNRHQTDKPDDRDVSSQFVLQVGYFWPLLEFRPG